MKINMKNYITILLWIFYCLKTVCTSRGIFQIHIKNYELQSSLGLNKCCSNTNAKEIDSATKCLSQCRLFMKICLSIYQKNPYKYTCDIGESDIVTELLGNNILNHSTKVDYSLMVRERWQKNFNILTKIIHIDLKTQKEANILTLSSAVENVTPSTSWITKELSTTKDPFKLKVSFRYLCDKYYYGTECDKHCRPSSNERGHYNCSATGEKICHPGYTGKYCDKFTCNKVKCKHGACAGPNICSCHTGWKGKSCDECIPYPGCVNGDCRKGEKVGQILPLTCECKKGWGGMFCNIDLDYCSKHPKVCMNGGECQNFDDGSTNQQYKCVCKPGFEGNHCEKLVPDCSVRGCLNGGVCDSQKLTNRSICTCKRPYYGDRCQFNQTSCNESPCIGSNSKCKSDSRNGFYCQCAAGFSGRNCEIDQDECSTRPCLNDGMCIDRPSGFACVCPVGFSGDRCQVNKNDCQKLSCMNGALCIDRANHIECECKPGWNGPTCSQNMSQCYYRPCLNNGKCRDRLRSYECICPVNWKGKNCNIPTNNTTTNDKKTTEILKKCSINYCHNNGSCYTKQSLNSVSSILDQKQSIVCICKESFKGKFCNETVSPTPSIPPNNTTPFDDNSIRIFIVSIIFISISAIIFVVIFMYCKTYRNYSDKAQLKKSENIAGRAQIKVLNNKLTRTNSSNTNYSKEKVPLSLNKLNNQLSQSELQINNHNQARLLHHNPYPPQFCDSANFIINSSNPTIRSFQCQHQHQIPSPAYPENKSAITNSSSSSITCPSNKNFLKSYNHNQNNFYLPSKQYDNNNSNDKSSSSLLNKEPELETFGRPGKNELNRKISDKNSFDSNIQKNKNNNINCSMEGDLDARDLEPEFKGDKSSRGSSNMLANNKRSKYKNHGRSSSHNSLLEGPIKPNLRPVLSQQIYQPLFPLVNESTNPLLVQTYASNPHTNLSHYPYQSHHKPTLLFSTSASTSPNNNNNINNNNNTNKYGYYLTSSPNQVLSLQYPPYPITYTSQSNNTNNNNNNINNNILTYQYQYPQDNTNLHHHHQPHNSKINYNLISNPVFHETSFLYNSSAQSIETNSTIVEDGLLNNKNS